MISLVKIDDRNAESVENVIDWLKQKQSENKVNKLSLIIEDSERNVHAIGVNLKNRDYAFFLMQEIFELFGDN